MLFDNIAPLLRGPVGNNFDNEENDVKNLKTNFKKIGRYEPEVENGIIDRELNDALFDFQREKGLKVDGFAKPGGETEATLIGDILGIEDEAPAEDTRVAALPLALLVPPVIGAIGRAAAGRAITAAASSRIVQQAPAAAWAVWQNLSTEEREDEIDKLECDRQYQVHTQRCNDVTKQKGARAGAVCYESAADIYADCLKGVPKEDRPDLMD